MQFQNKITIAIDGHSSCGKSTLAKALAKELNYVFVDSGAMYRGVTLFCIREGLIIHNEPLVEAIVEELPSINLHFELNKANGIAELYLNNENVEHLIRNPDVAANVSQIAAIAEVRKKLVAEQQKMGNKGGIIMDGRDIGSVVFPKAEIKFFVTAQPEIRAERRFLELKNKGILTSFDAVLENLTSRDLYDSTRLVDPLRQSKDAILIDTSDLTPSQQFQIALKKIVKTLEKLN